MIGLPALALDFSELSPLANIAVPLLGVLLITVGMLMGIRKKRLRASANMSARDHVDELRQKQAVRGDLEQLMIEVEQLAKRFGTQLDAKTMRMERLIDEADRKIAELKKLEHTRPNVPAGQPPQAPPLTPQAPAPDPDTVLKSKVCDLADQGHDPIEIARQLDEHVGKIELILALRKT